MKHAKALILIDVQNAFFDRKWGVRNNPHAEENMKKILEKCRADNWTIVHIQHVSDSPGSLFYKEGEGVKIKELVAPYPGEKMIQKRVNSAFIGTDLNEYLASNHIEQVVIVGLTTPHCVSTTTRMSGNLGYQTYLISDATAAFELEDHLGQRVDAQTVHHMSLAALHNEFATVMDTRHFLELMEREKE